MQDHECKQLIESRTQYTETVTLHLKKSKAFSLSDVVIKMNELGPLMFMFLEFVWVIGFGGNSN